MRRQATKGGRGGMAAPRSAARESKCARAQVPRAPRATRMWASYPRERRRVRVPVSTAMGRRQAQETTAAATHQLPARSACRHAATPKPPAAAPAPAAIHTRGGQNGTKTLNPKTLNCKSIRRCMSALRGAAHDPARAHAHPAPAGAAPCSGVPRTPSSFSLLREVCVRRTHELED
jgi:hypothetical protein